MLSPFYIKLHASSAHAVKCLKIKRLDSLKEKTSQNELCNAQPVLCTICAQIDSKMRQNLKENVNEINGGDENIA